MGPREEGRAGRRGPPWWLMPLQSLVTILGRPGNTYALECCQIGPPNKFTSFL